MSITRTLFIIATYPVRLCRRRGFGVQSPNDYSLVRDVLFEDLHYYAYEEQNLTTESDRQLWRLRYHFRADELIYVSSTDDAAKIYEETAAAANDNTVLVVDGLMHNNASLWKRVLHDSRARVTFDLMDRGIITFDKKRIKQNYIL